MHQSMPSQIQIRDMQHQPHLTDAVIDELFAGLDLGG